MKEAIYLIFLVWLMTLFGKFESGVTGKTEVSSNKVEYQRRF